MVIIIQSSAKTVLKVILCTWKAVSLTWMSPKSTGEVHWSRYSVSLTKFLKICQPVKSRAVQPLLRSSWPTPLAEQFSGTEKITVNCTWGWPDSVLEQVFLFLPCLWGTPIPWKGSAPREEKPYLNGISLSSRAQRSSLTIHFPAGLCVTWWMCCPLRIFEFTPPTAAFSVAE